jgi:hypothetical protein
MTTFPNHPDIPAYELLRLADKHGINPEASYMGQIDFQRVMNYVSYKYQIMSNLKFDTGQQKNKRKNWPRKQEDWSKQLMNLMTLCVALMAYQRIRLIKRCQY